MIRIQLLIFVWISLVYSDAIVYSVYYVSGQYFSPYIYKLQSDSAGQRLWIRSFPLYDTNLVASVMEQPTPVPWGKIMGGLQYTTSQTNELQLVTLQTYQAYNGTLYTRFTYHDANPLSISTLGYLDITPPITPLIFSSGYRALITTNSTLDPLTAQPLNYAQPFNFNPNGSTWISYKGYYELILNYDYPYIHIIDTSTSPKWNVSTVSITKPFTSNPTNLYFLFANYTAVASGSTIYLYRSIDFSVAASVTIPGSSITKLFYLDNYALYGWDNSTTVLWTFSITSGPNISINGNFTFPRGVYSPVMATNAMNPQTGVYTANMIVETGIYPYQSYGSLSIYPANCSNGYYSDLGGCKLCPIGTTLTSQSVFGVSSCTQCQVGYYANDLRTSCVICPPGYTTDSLHYLYNPAYPCFPCPAGTYDNGTRTCSPCTGGMYSTSGSTKCSACSPGTVTVDHATCTKCPLGTYDDGNNNCQSCPGLTYTPNDGSTYCTACSVNMVPVKDGNTCEKCPSGQFADNSTAACSGCPSGTYSTDTGCARCPPGQTSYGGTFSCFACDNGTVPAEDQSYCVSCSPGTYALSGDSNCTVCGPGTFTDWYAGSECVICKDGTYTTSFGTSVCDMCEQGYGTSSDGTECVACPPGTFGRNKGGGCLPCSANSYNPNNASKECLPCPEGAYCPVRSGEALSSEVALPSVVAGGYKASSDSTLNSSVLTSFLVTGGIGLFILLIFFLLLAVGSCCEGKRLGKFSDLLVRLDLLYSTKHARANGSYLINEQKVSGGFFTISAFATIFVLVVSSLVQYATSNVIVRSTIEPGVPTQQTLQDIVIFLTLNSKVQCDNNTVYTQTSGFPSGNVDYQVYLTNDGFCQIMWHCGGNCVFQFGKEVFMFFDFGTTNYIPSWNVSVSTPYFRNQRFYLQSNTVPQGQSGSVFHSGESDLIVILTPAVYTPISSSVQNAFQLQYGAVNPGQAFYYNSSDPGSVLPDSTEPLTFKLSLQQNTVTYKEDEIARVAPLGMLSQLLALIGGSITFWGIIMTGVDKLMLKKRPEKTEIEM